MQSGTDEYSSWQKSRERAAQHIREGQLNEALSVLIEISGASGLSDPMVAVTLDDLGTVYHALGRHSDAEHSYLRAIRLLDDRQMAREPVMSRLLDNLASLYMDTGHAYAQVERLRRRALALRIAEVGPEGPGIATLLSNLATACMAQERNEEAATLFQRALTMMTKTPGYSQPDFARVLQNMIVLSAKQERYSEAMSYATRAVAALEQALRSDHPDLIRPLLNLARLQVVMNRPLAAEPALSRALSIAEAKLGSEHPVIADIMSTWAEVFQRTRRKAEANDAKRRASAIAELNPRSSVADHSVHVSELMRKKASGPR